MISDLCFSLCKQQEPNLLHSGQQFCELLCKNGVIFHWDVETS
jgi:hypothetical protein